MKVLLTIGVVITLSSCHRKPDVQHRAEAPAFELIDVTDQTGPHFTTTCGEPTPTQIVEVNGPGITLFHADSDGDLDIFVANGATMTAPKAGPGSRLFFNQLSETGTLQFKDVTPHSGIDLHAWATSATAFDLEGDGDEDLYVTCIGEDHLLRNDGHGHFVDITSDAGVRVDGWSTGAAPGDIDGDGDLDLYITRYIAWDFGAPPIPPVSFRGEQVIAGPTGLPPQGDRLLLNNGDGTFIDATTSSTLADIPAAYGLNATILDLERDGTAEVLVGNDGMANHLLIFDSTSPLRLHDVAHVRGFATNMSGATQATMGLAIADVDGTGTPDVFSSNFSSDTNTLLSLEGTTFVDRTNAMAIGSPSRTLLGWTSRFIDFDLDGDEDLIVFNGHVYPNATPRTMNSSWKQSPLLLLRDGMRFRPLQPTEGSWLEQRAEHRAAAFGDLDGDGDLDMVSAQRCGPVQVIENRSTSRMQTMVVQLHDDRPDSGNPRGLGARISTQGPNGIQTRWMLPETDFQGFSAAQVHFAVPDIKTVITVDWPDGVTTTHDVNSEGIVNLRFSSGQIVNGA